PDGLAEPPCTKLVETPSASQRRPRHRSRACRPHSIRPPTRPGTRRSGHAHETEAARLAIGPEVRVPKPRLRCRPPDRRWRVSVGPASAATWCPKLTG